MPTLPPEQPVCAADCATQALPKVNFSECGYEINSSEIEDIFIGKADIDPLDDWSDPAEWATRLSQTAVLGQEIRRLTVVGDKPAPAETKKTISKGRETVIDRTHTLNFDVDETNDDNYEMMRAIQCGGKFRIWYKPRGGKLYGGSNGILVSLSGFDVLARGDESEKFQYTATWKNLFDPPRIDSPI